jgi:hypothetical protein
MTIGETEKPTILELSSTSFRNWNNGIMEFWPPARRAYASERMMGFGEMGHWDFDKISIDIEVNKRVTFP